MAAPTTVDRRKLALLVVPIVILVIAANVGTALAPTLVVNNPVLLIALDARIRHLLLVVAAGIGPLPFFLVGFLRLVVSDPLFYLLGREFGPPAMRWAERRMGLTPAYVQTIERWFAKIGPVLVAAIPNNLICLLAGVTRMRPRTFLVLNVGGTLVRLAIIWWLGKALQEPLDVVLRFISRYQWALVAISVAVVVLQVAIQQRRGQGELESVEQVAEQLEAAAEELEAEAEIDHAAQELAVDGLPAEQRDDDPPQAPSPVPGGDR